MSRRALQVLVLSLSGAVAAGADISNEDLRLTITTDQSVVEFGKAFPLEVVRTWSRELVPEEWSDRQLAPLSLRLLDTSRRKDDRHVEETRRYSCYAFSLEQVVIRAPTLRATPVDGGAEREVSGNSLTIEVKPSLQPGEPGQAELPGELLPAPPSSSLPYWGGGMALIALALVLLVRRTRRSEEASGPPPIPPHVRALDRLERLRDASLTEAAHAFHLKVSWLLRDYLSARFGVNATGQASEETLDDLRSAEDLTVDVLEILEKILRRCDLVKFAHWSTAVDDRERLLDQVEQFVLETRIDEEPAEEETA